MRALTTYYSLTSDLLLTRRLLTHCSPGSWYMSALSSTLAMWIDSRRENCASAVDEGSAAVFANRLVAARSTTLARPPTKRAPPKPAASHSLKTQLEKVAVPAPA